MVCSSEKPVYYCTWRNKWIMTECKSLDDMIEVLKERTEVLKEMKTKGVTLELDGGIEDDYICLTTDDKDVAMDFGFVPEDDIDVEIVAMIPF